MTGGRKIESQELESRDRNYFNLKVQVIEIIFFSVRLAICKKVQQIGKALGGLGVSFFQV